MSVREDDRIRGTSPRHTGRLPRERNSLAVDEWVSNMWVCCICEQEGGRRAVRWTHLCIFVFYKDYFVIPKNILAPCLQMSKLQPYICISVSDLSCEKHIAKAKNNPNQEFSVWPDLERDSRQKAFLSEGLRNYFVFFLKCKMLGEEKNLNKKPTIKWLKAQWQ